MSRRILLVPAAGLGSRLGAAVPKLLVPVAGLPMIDRIAALYREYVREIVLIVHPSFETAVRAHVSTWQTPVGCAVQERRTGMLDAIMLARELVGAAAGEAVWITWCDQVAVHPLTVRRLAETTAAHPTAALVMPTVSKRAPYIHLSRGPTGRIEQVLQRREGDAMPEFGESDMGLFALTPFAYAELLPQYAREAPAGRSTAERNFLPFIPWLAAADHEVITFPPVEEIEAVGVNTPEELASVENYLARRRA
jgi:bifunctional UDP-N-acetylglucosamine pyrophosphorylase/glucosamine-1-phosphate N-acetyltransferase